MTSMASAPTKSNVHSNLLVVSSVVGVVISEIFLPVIGVVIALVLGLVWLRSSRKLAITLVLLAVTIFGAQLFLLYGPVSTGVHVGPAEVATPG